MRIPLKLALIIAIMVVPILAVVGMFLSDAQKEIDDNRLGADGIDYLIALRDVFEVVPQHRGAAAGVLGGDVRQQAALQRIENEVDEALAVLARVDQRLGPSLETTEHFEAIRNAWNLLERDEAVMTSSESFARHTEVIADVIRLMRHVADRSRLVVNPEIDASYLIVSAVERIPEATENLGVLRGLGNGIAARGSITQAEQVRLSELVAQINSSIAKIELDLEAAFEANPEIAPSLRPMLIDSGTRARDFLRVADAEIIQGEEVVADPAQYFALGTSAIDRLFLLYDQDLRELETLLAAQNARLLQIRRTQLSIVFVMTVTAILVAVFFQRGIHRQVTAISKFFDQVGVGEFDARCEVTSQDELGRLAENLNVTFEALAEIFQQTREDKERLQKGIAKLLEEVSDVAMGDLTVEAEVTEEVTGAIADSFNFMIEQLREIILNVQDTTLQVNSAATEIQATAAHLAEGSESQAAQIVGTTSAIDEMSASIQEVSQNAASASEVAMQALSSADQGAQAVNKTIQGMAGIRQQVQETSKRIKRLGESSQEIGEIVQLIGDIADRTSILALNASIQAAAAGEAGRGFAVVAEEVERLADRSAAATKRIESLIKTIQSETGETAAAMEQTTHEVVVGSTLANEAGQALSEIESVSNRLAGLITSISLSAEQQARGSESVARAMGAISAVTQQTAAGTKQAEASIRDLARLADQLRESVSTFKMPTQAV